MKTIIEQLQAIVRRSEGMAAELTRVRKEYARLQEDIDALHTEQGRLQVDAGSVLTQAELIMVKVEQARTIVRSVAAFSQASIVSGGVRGVEQQPGVTAGLGALTSSSATQINQQVSEVDQVVDDTNAGGGQASNADLGVNTPVKGTDQQMGTGDEERRASEAVEDDLKENPRSKRQVARTQVIRLKDFVYESIRCHVLSTEGNDLPHTSKRRLGLM